MLDEERRISDASRAASAPVMPGESGRHAFERSTTFDITPAFPARLVMAYFALSQVRDQADTSFRVVLGSFEGTSSLRLSLYYVTQ